ncbi:MAG: hypothetical protein P4L99_20865 [Chthoniobacter sp.]|nr:hypothetical protein [Chthoniobacter sp.]
MNLNTADLELLATIANLRALLTTPGAPLLNGTLRDTMRRRESARASLARLELQWLNRGLATAGLPPVPESPTRSSTPVAQCAPRAYRGPDTHHF